MASSIGKRRTPLARFFVVERAKRGWSQENLADVAGVGVATVRRLESGASDLRGIEVGTTVALARALEVDISRLVRLAEQEERENHGD